LYARNRIISGLADATFIAQTGVPGPLGPAGTLHTARSAIEQGRPLVVARPAGAWADDERSAGNLALTHPSGCDPALLGASDPTVIAMIAARKPIADLVIRDRADLLTLWVLPALRR